MKNKNEMYLKLIILAVLIAVAIIFSSQIYSIYESTEEFVVRSGSLGPLILILALVLGVLISPIPTAPMAVLSGILFGPLGAVYTLIGATIGAVIAFLISRFFLGDFIHPYLEKSQFYREIRGKNKKNLARIVFLTRLMPQVSFDIVSYAAGLTNMSLLNFVLATFFGMIPIVLTLTFFGSFFKQYSVVMMIILSIVFLIYASYFINKSKNQRNV